MICRSTLSILPALLLCAPALRAESPGSLVDGFSPELTAEALSLQVAPTPEGGLLLAGDFETVNGEPRPGFTKLRPDGSFDPLFQSSVGLGRTPSLESLFPFRNGRILITARGAPRVVVGTQFDGNQLRLVLQPDGSIVSSPFLDGLPDDISLAPLVEHGNRIFLRTRNNFTQHAGFVVLDPTTLRERSFPVAGTWPGVPLDIVPASDGYWILGGGSREQSPVLFRTHLDGTTDANFPPQTLPPNDDEPFFNLAHHLLPAPDDGFLLIEQVTSSIVVIGRPPLSRNVTVHTYESHGRRIDTQNFAVGLQSPALIRREADGSTLLSSPDGASLSRYGIDGVRDESFFIPIPQPLPTTAVSYSFLSTIEFAPLPTTPDGRFWVGARRFFSDGSPDATWVSPRLRKPGSVHRLAPAGGDTFYAAGEFSSVDGTPVPNLARFTRTGQLDRSFRPAPGIPHLTFHDTFPDGSLLVSLDPESPSLARLRPDGSLDPSFQPASATIRQVLEAKVDRRGNVLALVDRLAAPVILPSNLITRLFPDGTPDPDFFHTTRDGGVFFDAESARGPITVLNDNSYLAFRNRHSRSGALIESLPGTFAAHHTGDSFLIARPNFRFPRVPLLERWHPTQGRDQTFHAPFLSLRNATAGIEDGRGSLLSLVHGLRDGRILTAGSLATQHGSYRGLRLHPGGRPDFAFAPPNPSHLLPQVPGVEVILEQGVLETASLSTRRHRADFNSALELDDGSIVVGGLFSHLGSARRSGLARLCGGVAGTFENWCVATFARSELPVHLVGPNDDPDDDGATNFYEFAVGSDPLAPEFDAFQPRIIGTDPPRWTLPRNPDAANVVLVVEISSNLQSWRAAEGDEITLEVSDTAYTFTQPTAQAQSFVRARFVMP